MKKIIATPQAPAAIGPYSQAVEVNGTLYISGQIPIVPESGALVEGGVAAQTTQSLKNIGAILHEAGYDFADVVKTTCLLADMADFQEFNAAYSAFFDAEPPARATFAVRGLPRGAAVEIEAIAVK
jgi:2-iminobutanoate/2-iminopropanoate deaminase